MIRVKICGLTNEEDLILCADAGAHALGFVVDYIHVSFFPPVFNFADCCVVIGTVLVMVHVLFFSERRDAE